MSTLRNAGLRLSWMRRVARVGSALGTAALLGGLVACADAPSAPTLTAPTDGPSSAVLSLPALGAAVTGVLWTKPATLATSSRVIGPEGGQLSIPGGITITVPRGAVSSNVTFSVTRLPGRLVAYDFQPHGTKFAVPLQVEQPTSGTNASMLPPIASFRGAYFADPSALDQLRGTAVISEFRPTAVPADRSSIRFTVDHFSGYIVCWGRW